MNYLNEGYDRMEDKKHLGEEYPNYKDTDAARMDARALATMQLAFTATHKKQQRYPFRNAFEEIISSIINKAEGR